MDNDDLATLIRINMALAHNLAQLNNHGTINNGHGARDAYQIKVELEKLLIKINKKE